MGEVRNSNFSASELSRNHVKIKQAVLILDSYLVDFSGKDFD